MGRFGVVFLKFLEILADFAHEFFYPTKLGGHGVPTGGVCALAASLLKCWMFEGTEGELSEEDRVVG